MRNSELFRSAKSDVLTQSCLAYYGNYEGFLFLDGGANSDSYICTEPVRRYSYHGNLDFRVRDSESEKRLAQPFFEGFAANALPWLVNTNPEGMFIPLLSGYLSYEIQHEIEKLPTVPTDPYGIPQSLLYAYRSVLRIPPYGGDPTLFQSDGEPFWRVDWNFLCNQVPKSEPHSISGRAKSLLLDELAAVLAPFASWRRSTYERAVLQVQELIVRGSVYQVNLSQRFSVPVCQDAIQVYRALRATGAGNYFAYLCARDQEHKPFWMLSTSPELFFRCHEGELLCSPIKGTAPRLHCIHEESNQRGALMACEKNRAELAMIVDLVRNDLSRICVPGSVSVGSFPRLMELPHLYHLVADISGRLDSNKNLLDALRALFPSGSVTGAPKIAAMRYIAEIEQATRGVYCGSVGFFASPSSGMWNVAIRTGILRDGKFIFQSGGGITIDSDPREEYDESLIKAAAILDGLQGLAAHA